MKTYRSKIIIKLKPSINDIKGKMTKHAIESLIEIENLTCRVGTSYLLTFDAQNQVEALNLVKKISQELLVNEMIEVYEIKSLEEI